MRGHWNIQEEVAYQINHLEVWHWHVDEKVIKTNIRVGINQMPRKSQ